MNARHDVDFVLRHPEHLWWVVPVVLVLGILILLEFRSARTLFVGHPILRFHGMGARSVSRSEYAAKWFWSALLVLLLAVAWSEPVYKKTTHNPVWGGVRVAFLLDTSFSMKYGHDVPPYADRLLAAKSVLADFATMTRRDAHLKGKYHLALIPFAGEAMTYLAFSKSTEEFTEAIDNIDEATIGAPGTNMLNALFVYEELWKTYPPADEHTVDIIVLLTDGGRGEGNRKDLPGIKAILGKFPKTVSIYTVGIGSVVKTVRPDGTIDRRTAPVELSSLDKDGKLIRFLLADENNPNSKRLTSELDEEVLIEIARDRGQYFFYEGKGELLASLRDAIVTKRKLESTTPHVTETDIAALFLWPALLIAFFLFGSARHIFELGRSVVRRKSVQ